MGGATREPILIRAAIIGAVTSILDLLYLIVPVRDDVRAAISVALNAVAFAVMVVWSRGAVTPLSDPRSANGTPLVPARGPTVPPPPPRQG